MKKIAIIGLGYIGNTIIEAVNDGSIDNAVIHAVYDIDQEIIAGISEKTFSE